MEEDVSSSGFLQHKRSDAHIQRATSLPTKAPADATPLPLIDWQSPGSALHDHAEQQKLITVSVPSSPMPRRIAAVPEQSKAGQQQRRNISDIRQADRGAKLVFGGKLPASRIPTTPPSECRTSQAGRKSRSGPKGSSSADPWLASWQPKAKPTGEDKNQSSETKSKPSTSAWRTPSLEWAVTKPETLPAAPPIEAKEDKPSQKPQKPKTRLKNSPSPGSKSMPDASRHKAPETIPTLNKRAALQHLAQLRNLRRLPLPGSAASLSAPVTPSAATTSDLPESELPVHKLLRRTISQPTSPVLASPACTATESESSCANLVDRSGHDEGPDSSLPLDGIKQGSYSPVKPGKQKLLERRLPKLLPSGVRPLSNSTVLDDTSQQTASGTSVVHRQSAELAAESSLAMPDMEGLSQETDSPQRVMCEGCGRGFNPKAYAVHSKICAKVFKKERKVHAAEKDGDLETDVLLKATPESLASITSIAMASSALQKGKSPNKGLENQKGQAPQPGKLPKWKQQSAQLRAAMLAAKPDKLGQAAAAFPGAVVPTDDLVPCPHCKRRFAEATAERHIPKCKETVHKASRLKVGGGKAAHMRNPAAPK